MKEKNSDIGSLISLFFSFVKKERDCRQRSYSAFMLERASGDSPLQLNNLIYSVEQFRSEVSKLQQAALIISQE